MVRPGNAPVTYAQDVLSYSILETKVRAVRANVDTGYVTMITPSAAAAILAPISSILLLH